MSKPKPNPRPLPKIPVDEARKHLAGTIPLSQQEFTGYGHHSPTKRGGESHPICATNGIAGDYRSLSESTVPQTRFITDAQDIPHNRRASRKRSKPLESDPVPAYSNGRGVTSMVLIHEAFGNFDFSDSVDAGSIRGNIGHLEQNFHANLNFGNSYVPASYPERAAPYGLYRGFGRACGNFTFSGGSANTYQNFYPMVTCGPGLYYPSMPGS